MTDRLTVLSSMATRQVLAELAGSSEEQSRAPVTIRPVAGVEAARLVRAGEPVDVIILASKVMEALEAEGHVVAGTRVGFARSGMAVAVRAGTAGPPIEDEDSVRRAILDARGIGYSTGPSGDHLMRLIERWGVAASVLPRLRQAPPGVPVGAMLARGEADLGFQQLSELLHVPGIEILGPLPSEIQAVTVFVAGIAQASGRRDDARALIASLASGDAEAAKRRHGLEPA